MRRYELMLLLRPDLEDDKLQSAVEKVTRAIVNAGGSLTKVSPWGKRRLAYDIKRFREASYFLIHFDIEPAQVRGIERGMLISEEILRHLVTLIEDRGPARQELPAAAPERGAQRSEDEAVSQPPDVEAAAPDAGASALEAEANAPDGEEAAAAEDADAPSAVDTESAEEPVEA